ncbi:MAG: hypothetical protein ACK41C_09835 [Phenylobacterium sp.]|jgi:hypothetical protein
MTHGFQQQDPSAGFSIPKACPKPQHGRKADKAATKLSERRSFQPRPGH